MASGSTAAGSIERLCRKVEPWQSTMIDDEAISSRLIPGSDGWNIVFTREGRYFFWNPITQQKDWLPPEHLLRHLKETFTATRREMLFDLFCEEAVYLDESEGGSESESESESVEEIAIAIPVKSTTEINNDFKALLLEREIDPFAPWPSIVEALKSEAAFSAVPTDKKRQELLAECCPQLIGLKRAKRERQLREAREWFDEQCERMRAAGVHWSEAQRRLAGDERFGVLSLKECEKQYKSK